MDPRRLSCAALLTGAAILSGCITPPKSDPPEAPKAVAAAAVPLAAPPTPVSNAPDPMGRLRAFIAGDGLATTPAQPGQAGRLTAAWSNKVVFAPDPTKGGQPAPGLMGKLWLFGPPDEGIPLSLDGEVFVGIWDNSPTVNGGEPTLIEVWHFDAEALRKVRRKDFIGGEAYNLFLPSSKYHVDLKQINVVARFNCADGRSLVASPDTLTLDHAATLERAKQRLEGLSPGPVARPSAAGPMPGPLPNNLAEAPPK